MKAGAAEAMRALFKTHKTERQLAQGEAPKKPPPPVNAFGQVISPKLETALAKAEKAAERPLTEEQQRRRGLFLKDGRCEIVSDGTRCAHPFNHEGRHDF